MISSVGSYDVTAFNADRSSSALVAIGWPICRLEPWPMISSGCSLARAARTTCSTSFASRTLSVSTPSVTRSSHDPVETAVFVAAIRIPHHPSKDVADRYKGELDERQRGHPPASSLAAQTSSGVSACSQHSYFDRYRSIHENNSSYIELYSSLAMRLDAR